jgi:DNA-binding NarL/FixJ family response regulator
VVATTDNPDTFLAAVDAHKPDVAIVDVRMPPTHTDEGITAAVEARRRQPDLAVLVLSAYVEQAFATELLGGGATRLGYLLKERVGRVEQFQDALHRVVGGGTAIDPEVVAQLLTRTRPDASGSPPSCATSKTPSVEADSCPKGVAGRRSVHPLAEPAGDDHIRYGTRLHPMALADA